jgi:hypothetical protein
MLYETKRQSPAIRESTSAGYYHAALRENVPGCRERTGFIAEFSRSVVAGVQERRPPRHSKSGEMGTTTAPCRSAAKEFKEDPASRGVFCRIHHRFMDAEAYRTADSKRIRYSLYKCRSLEITAPEFRMELPETGKTCIATGRKSNCGMESKNLAPDKKKPEDLGPILRFWMKAGSCLFPLSAKHGLQPVVRQFCGTVTGGIKYRRSAVLPYRRVVKESVSSSGFTRTTSLGMKLSVSFGICCAMFAKRLFSYGTADRFTNVRTLKNSWKRRDVFMCIDFPAMLLNSIRLNMFGHMASATCRTARMKPLPVWDRICDGRWLEYVVRKIFSGRVSSIQNFRGLEQCVSIIS